VETQGKATFLDADGQIVVPPGEARAVRLHAGAVFSVVDLDGGQVGDLFAFNADDTTEFASASHTRSITRKLFPLPSEAIHTNLRRAMLMLESDHSPRRHDTLFAACDPQLYKMLGVTTEHRSCATNLNEVMARHGGLAVPTPQPFNIFMNVMVDPAGKTSLNQAKTRPGDNLVFRALMDTIIVLSSCPMDVNPISVGDITRLAIRVP